MKYQRLCRYLSNTKEGRKENRTASRSICYTNKRQCEGQAESNTCKKVSMHIFLRHCFIFILYIIWNTCAVLIVGLKATEYQTLTSTLPILGI